jgi:hypothetical protein
MSFLLVETIGDGTPSIACNVKMIDATTLNTQQQNVSHWYSANVIRQY